MFDAKIALVHFKKSRKVLQGELRTSMFFLVYDQIVGYDVSMVAILRDALFVVSLHVQLGIA